MTICTKNCPVRDAQNGTLGGGLFFRILALVALVLMSLQPLPAHATFFGGGSGGATFDATSAGENAGNPDAGIFTSDLVIANAGTIITFNSINLDNFVHTAIGDLVFQLTHVDTGTAIIFLQRARKVSPTVGYGSDVNLTGNFTFSNSPSSFFGSADSVWRAAFDATNSGSGIINGGVFAASSNAFGGNFSSSYKASGLNLFSGETVAGTWRLTIRDEAINDIGSLGSWGFNATVTSVPEAESLALMLVGGGVMMISISRWRAKRR